MQFTQIEQCLRTLKKRASYVLTVKGNQGILEGQLAALFEDAQAKFPELVYSFEQHEKNHGRIEFRKISVLNTARIKLAFPGVQQAALLHRERTIVSSGKTTSDAVFLITDLEFPLLNAQEFARLKRMYWYIENKLHYRKDLVFGEDRSTIRALHGPQNMSSLRNFAVGLLTCLGITNVKRCVDNLQHTPLALLPVATPSHYRKAA